MQDKRMSLKEAVSQFVTDGCSIAVSSVGAREPLAAINEIVRQKKKDMTLIADSHTNSGERLIAGGCLSRVEFAYLWMGVMIGWNWRRAVEKGIPNVLELEEYSKLIMPLAQNR